MVTFKNVKMFVENGITYFGIPEDMILYYLDQAIKTKEKIAFENRKDIIQKLGVIASVQAEIDIILANKIESTIIEQITESKKLLTERAQWVMSTVKFDQIMNSYRFTNDNLYDLNKRLKIQYKLSWVYKILANRHATIAEGFVKEGPWKPGTRNVQKRMASIDIPKPVIDKILAGLAKAEATRKTTIQEPVTSKPAQKVEATQVQQPQTELPKDEQEIAELVLLIVERDERIDVPILKGKVERAVESGEITWDVFTRIIEYLAKVQLLVLDGNTVRNIKRG